LKLGTCKEDIIGLFLPRSFELFTGIFGILKAGAAYLPIEADYPDDRIEFMLSDAKVKYVLSCSSLEERLNSINKSGYKIITIDENKEIFQQKNSNPEVSVTLKNLSYIIYTSGSTGKPKGTMIEHRGLTNYLLWAVDKYDLKNGNGAPFHSPISFDATITSLFCPLISGKTVSIIPSKHEIEGLMSIFNNDNDFSLIKITPAHLDLLKTMFIEKDKMPESNSSRFLIRMNIKAQFQSASQLQTRSYIF